MLVNCPWANTDQGKKRQSHKYVAYEYVTFCCSHTSPITGTLSLPFFMTNFKIQWPMPFGSKILHVRYIYTYGFVINLFCTPTVIVIAVTNL